MPMKTESMSGRDDGVATDGQLPPSPSTPTNPLCSHLVTRYGSSSDSSRRRGTLYEINLFKLFKTHSKRLLPWQKICISRCTMPFPPKRHSQTEYIYIYNIE